MSSSSVGLPILCGFGILVSQSVAGEAARESAQPIVILSVEGLERIGVPTPVTAEVRPRDLDVERFQFLWDARNRLFARPAESESDERSDAMPVQVDPIGDAARPEALRLLFVPRGPFPDGTRRFELVEADGAHRSPWTFEPTDDGQLLLKQHDLAFFQYNREPVTDPDHPHPNQPRSAYIHPAWSPDGAIVTGDYSDESHPHHRGFFLAYTKTEVGDLHPDFWNLQGGSGKVHFDRLGAESTGPVSARLTVHHRWEAHRPDGRAPIVVLRERWDLEAYETPGADYRLIDLTATQQAVEKPMRLPRYRYGGMAYRGPDSFFPRGVLDVLTSAGHDRVEGDQKPARWVDLTGPIASGSNRYAGAAMLDHPSNINHPTPARIHPTRLPFFCYVPSHDVPVTIGTAEPLVLKYRIVIHDGHPDAERNERLWRAFAEPVRASIAAP